MAATIDTKLRSIAAKHGASYVPVIPYLCPEKDRCQPYKDGTVFYYDPHHLSMSGARKIARDFLAPHVFGPASRPAD